MVVSVLLASEVTKALLCVALVPVAAVLARSAGFSLWLSHWCLLAHAVLALHVGDVPYYAYHRAPHELAPLWRLHATHHSVERLY